jgi:hypothetical protein
MGTNVITDAWTLYKFSGMVEKNERLGCKNEQIKKHQNVNNK